MPTARRRYFRRGRPESKWRHGSTGRRRGRLRPVTHWPDPDRADPLLVLSGSCSPVTAGQIDWALAHGFAEVALDTRALAQEGSSESARAMENAMAAATGHLQAGRMVGSAHQPGRSGTNASQRRPRRLAAAGAVGGRNREGAGSAGARLLGGALGLAARGVLERLGGRSGAWSLRAAILRAMPPGRWGSNRWK